jgi:hypothetical protein
MLAILCCFGRVRVRVLCVFAMLAIGQAAVAQKRAARFSGRSVTRRAASFLG